MPHCEPSPSSASKRGVSCGVLMSRMSRMPASISVRQRVVHHRLVVHRQQLLAHGQRGRVQPRAGAAGEDDALACVAGSWVPCG